MCFLEKITVKMEVKHFFMIIFLLPLPLVPLLFVRGSNFNSFKKFIISFASSESVALGSYSAIVFKTMLFNMKTLQHFKK